MSTRVARSGPDIAAMLGAFDLAPLVRSGIGLFHVDGRRFNAFRAPLRTGSHITALDAEADMPMVAARLPLARMLQEGRMSVVEVDDGDLALLLGMAEEA